MNSSLVQVENIEEIAFCDYKLKLYGNCNLMREIYEDKRYQDSYKKIRYNENQNSLLIFMKVNGINILLGGDALDRQDIHPKANYVNYQTASLINEQIDIYKVPHHGTINCNSEKTLQIYKPKIAVITNGDDYLKNESTIYQDLKKSNKNVKILLTENYNVVININNKGSISYKEIL